MYLLSVVPFIQPSPFGVVERILRQGSTPSLGVSSSASTSFSFAPFKEKTHKVIDNVQLLKHLQVRQLEHPNNRNSSFYMCNCGSFTSDGNSERIPTRFEAPLGGVSEQILCRRWIQIFPLLLFSASGGG